MTLTNPPSCSLESKPMPLRQYNAHYLPWKPSEKQVNGCVYLNKCNAVGVAV